MQPPKIWHYIHSVHNNCANFLKQCVTSYTLCRFEVYKFPNNFSIAPTYISILLHVTALIGQSWVQIGIECTVEICNLVLHFLELKPPTVHVSIQRYDCALHVVSYNIKVCLFYHVIWFLQLYDSFVRTL